MDSGRPERGRADFQYGGRAWSPWRPDVRDLLRSSRYAKLEPIYFGSNHCFLATMESNSEGRSLAVYKPARGEYPLYDFASGTLYQREIASWIVDHMLGWNLVPPTVDSKGRYGRGSLQLFIESRESGDIDLRELQRLSVLDVILNNADRKSDHILIGDDGKLWAIDHGLTFHAYPKLRTVLWHFAGSQIPDDLLEDLRRVARCLNDSHNESTRRLQDLLDRDERQALAARVRGLVETGRFPNPRHKAVPYRW